MCLPFSLRSGQEEAEVGMRTELGLVDWYGEGTTGVGAGKAG